MNPIASDLNNTDFQGASNPDARLAVQFYKKAIPNEFESNKQGRPIFMDMDFIMIMVPGDNLSIVHQFVREDHKARFPKQWLYYQNTHGGDTKEMGTPLAQWPRVSLAQAEELRALKFYTVESIATASDAQLQRIGMVAGMSPYAFRDHAIRYLKTAEGDSVAQEAESRAKAAEDRAAKLEADMLAQKEETAKQLADMQALIQSLAQKKKPGRPAKAKE